MLLPERQNPYLTRLPRAVEELLGVEPGPLQQKRDGSAFAYDPSAMAGRYMHLQLTPRMWSDLEVIHAAVVVVLVTGRRGWRWMLLSVSLTHLSVYPSLFLSFVC